MEIRKFTPPIVKDFYKKHISRYGWFGDYPSWESAHDASLGYNSDNILQKVKKSLLKVKNGTAEYERDSVLFGEKEYSAAVLAGLLLAKKANSLSVIDFGGSLGTTYFQNKAILNEIKAVSWSVIEQKNFVKCGGGNFQDERLKFYGNFGKCLEKESPNILILSGVLQYLEKPYEFIEKVLNKKFEYILIDRTPFVSGRNRITVQRVNPRIYSASYPCWFFNEKQVIDLFLKKYSLVGSFHCLDASNISSKFKGFLFRIK